jgi:hypothetical protein
VLRGEHFDRRPKDAAEREAVDNFDSDRCPAGWRGWVCTRKPGHFGDHVGADCGGIGGIVRARWAPGVVTGVFPRGSWDPPRKPDMEDEAERDAVESDPDGKMCSAEHDDDTCTRLPGHSGDHVCANIDNLIDARWAQEESDEEERSDCSCKSSTTGVCRGECSACQAAGCGNDRSGAACRLTRYGEWAEGREAYDENEREVAAGDGDPCCNEAAPDSDSVCTREEGHLGDHIAGVPRGVRPILARWRK